MLKKHLSLLLALWMLISFALPAANGEETEPRRLTNADGFVYTVNADGSAEIVGYTGKSQKLVIPEKVDGYPVTSIGKGAFMGAPITELTVAKSVKTIRADAFAHCNSLTDARLSEGLEVMEGCVFWQCRKLKTVNLPDSLTTIGEMVFSGCYELPTIKLSKKHRLLELVEGVLFNRETRCLLWYPAIWKERAYTVPKGTLSIGQYAFHFAEVTSVPLPDSLERISVGAFTNCRKLKKINIPPKVTELRGVFASTSSLTDIRVSPENPVFYDLDGVLFHRDGPKLVLYPAGRREERYEIPAGTQAIEDSAFNGASLTEIVIPGHVKSIGSSAFLACFRLKSVILSEGVERMLSFAFQHCAALTEIRLPASLTAVADNPFIYCSSLIRVAVDEENPALAIMDGALVNTELMRLVWFPLPGEETDYVVPDGIRVISKLAFLTCTRLTGIVLPEGVETIEGDAFKGCVNLKRIVLPASLTEIDKTAFLMDTRDSEMIPATYVVVKGSYAENFCQAYGLTIEYMP